MNAIAQSVQGEFYISEEKAVLVLDPACTQVYLRYAITEMGSGRLFFPELLLDDWGHEIGSLEMYRWIRKNGPQFPRAELFGYDRLGNNRQYFLRELDLYSLYPCFGYSQADEPIKDGLEVAFIVLAVEEDVQSQWHPTEAEIGWPIRNAAVSWWRIGFEQRQIFAELLLSSTSESGSTAEGDLPRDD